MLFNATSAMKIPWVPPLMQAHGYPVGSLTKHVRAIDLSMRFDAD